MIKIICVGRIKEKYNQDAINEYKKRISRFSKLEIIEVKYFPSKDNASPLDIEKVKDQEGEEILSKIKDEYVIALESDGIELDSISFSDKIDKVFTNVGSTLTFVIGGSLGLSSSVLKRSNYTMSFSKLTFPHQLFRVILLEQIYRAFKILNNEPYNK